MYDSRQCNVPRGRSSDQVGVDGRIKHSPECGEVSGNGGGCRDLRPQVNCFLDKPGVSSYQEHGSEMRAERRERLAISCRRCVPFARSRQPAV